MAKEQRKPDDFTITAYRYTFESRMLYQKTHSIETLQHMLGKSLTLLDADIIIIRRVLTESPQGDAKVSAKEAEASHLF